MALWNVTYEAKKGVHRHSTPSGFGHALLVSLVTDVLSSLRVSASLRDDSGRFWRLNTGPSLNAYEVEHGKDRERYSYNDRCFAKARRSRKPVRGEHAGCSDLFVPVVASGQVAAVLVAGPFARARPTAAHVLSRWQWLTGRQGHPADPEFSAYLATVLEILVLDGERSSDLEELLSCLAKLMVCDGPAAALVNQAEVLRVKLEPARRAERAWNAVQTMLDDRSQRTWASASRRWGLRELGLERIADHVLVGLTKELPSGRDPVEQLIVRDAFQRSVVDLARAAGGAVAGRVGDHGVVLLSSPSGSAERERRRHHDLALRVSEVGRRRFGLSLHFGLSVATPSLPLSRGYQAALAAAEAALTQGALVLTGDAEAKSPGPTLRQLQADLARCAVAEPVLLGARFDGYVEAVAAHCGSRVEVVWAHLEAALARMTEPLAANGALDAKGLAALWIRLDRAAAGGRTASELFAACRRAVADLAEAMDQPVAARQERSLERALDFIHQHYAEPLRWRRVAKMTGFAPNYFSLLFKRREGMTFERYVRGLRIERAKQYLADTDLDAARIAELSGFGSPQYFSRVFRNIVGVTPLAYRRRSMNKVQLKRVQGTKKPVHRRVR